MTEPGCLGLGTYEWAASLVWPPCHARAFLMGLRRSTGLLSPRPPGHKGGGRRTCDEVGEHLGAEKNSGRGKKKKRYQKTGILQVGDLLRRAYIPNHALLWRPARGKGPPPSTAFLERAGLRARPGFSLSWVPIGLVLHVSTVVTWKSARPDDALPQDRPGWPPSHPWAPLPPGMTMPPGPDAEGPGFPIKHTHTHTPRSPTTQQLPACAHCNLPWRGMASHGAACHSAPVSWLRGWGGPFFSAQPSRSFVYSRWHLAFPSTFPAFFNPVIKPKPRPPKESGSPFRRTALW